nr:LOW QUALITY PROTEIN: uncharacterized protein C1orf167 homolog [Desmodus rotundus]
MVRGRALGTPAAAGCGVDQGHCCPPGFALEPVELRPDASHKENVPPRPATPLRPGKRLKPRRLLETPSLDVVLGRWVPRGQAERGGPATAPSLGAVLLQEPCRVQTNLASPSPRLGLALKARTGPNRLINSSFQQQSNLQPLRNLSQGGARALAVQQSNLGTAEASLAECGSRRSPHLWSEPPESFWPHVMPLGSPLSQGPQAHPSSTLKQSWLLPTDTPCPDFRPTACYAPVDGHTWPVPSSWGGPGNWTSGLMGEPLTLEELAVPAKSQARAPAQAAMTQLLASVQCLEHEVARLRCRGTQEPPVPSQQEPWASNGQGLPACPQPSQPILASWDKRKKHPHGLRGAVNFPGTPGAWLGPSDSQAGSKPASPPPENTSEVLTEDLPDSEQGILPAYALRAAQSVHPGQEGGAETPREQGAPGPWGAGDRDVGTAAPGIVTVGRATGAGGGGHCCRAPTHSPGLRGRPACHQPWSTPSRQLLSRCFSAWRRLVQRRWAAAASVVMGQRQLLRRSLQALRWALRLREAQLEVAWSQHTRALLARSFQKWRNLTQQQKQEQPYIQAGPGPPPSGGGPSGRKPVVDPAQRSSPGSLKEEAGARSPPSPSGGERTAQILQALQQLAAFLLWCRRKEWARQEQKGFQRDTSGAMPSTRSMGRAPQAWSSPAADTAWVDPLDPQHQRAWLCRYFGAWRQVVKRGAQYPDHLADRPMGALRMCLKQWMRAKQLQASGEAKVTQRSLCQQKAENRALCSSAPGGATSHGLGVVAPAPGLPQERGRGSLKEACPRLALHQVLLLWRARLSQCQRADSFFQSTQRRMLRRILRVWHLTVWGTGTLSDSARTTWAPGLLGGVPGGEASLSCSPRCSSLEKDSSAPALLETLQLSFLWASGQRQQGRCLLRWQAQAQQSRGAARWHQRTLQRRVFLSWRHWAMAQGAWREMAARWAWDRSCRATLGLWRRWLEQRREAEQQVQEQGQRQARGALQHWHSCWQRQQFLHEQYRRWVQVRVQGLRRTVFQSWQRAAAQRRHGSARPEQLLLQSPFQAWCGSTRSAGMLRAQCEAFQDGLRRRALGAAFTTWWEARVAAAWTREHRTAWASIAHWRSHMLVGQADRQLRRARAQQAFIAWREALGQCREARQQTEERARAQAALCWTLWVPESHLHRLSPAHAAQKLNARVLEAWAQSASQGRVQGVAITQSQQVGHRHLLWTHWARWRRALLRVWLGPRMEAQETSTAHPKPGAEPRHWPRLAGRGSFLALMDTAAPGKQTHSLRPQGMEPRLASPGPTQHHSLGGQRESGEMPWAQRDSAVQLWTRWPGLTHWAQGQPPAGPGGDCSPEASTLTGKGQRYKRWLGRRYLRRWHLETLLCQLQGSQQARRLVATWQHWVDAQGAEELAQSLAVAPERGLANVAAAGRAAAGGSAIPAFEKWHQNLAARGLRRGAPASSLRLPSEVGIRSPRSGLEAARTPACGGLEVEEGPSCSCDLFPWKEHQN